MKFPDSQYYVEVKDHRYKIQPTEYIILRLGDPPNSFRTQYQFQNNIQIRSNQKVIRNDNDELIKKNYPKNRPPVIHQPKFEPPNCPTCKRNSWLEFDKGFHCQNCKYIINKQNHQLH